nr:hypothetical protein [Litchfieldia salsa]
MDIKELIRSWIDSIFSPFHSFLDMAIENLRNVSLTMAQGLDVGKYLSIFGDMPGPWQLVVVSILGSTFLLGALLIFRSQLRLYYAMKEGVKWW